MKVLCDVSMTFGDFTSDLQGLSDSLYSFQLVQFYVYTHLEENGSIGVARIFDWGVSCPTLSTVKSGVGLFILSQYVTKMYFVRILTLRIE